MQQLELRQTTEGADQSAEADGEGILRRIAAGDRDALADLYALYQRRLFRYLGLLTPDTGLAEEILQDTFVAIWRSASQFEARASVQAWIFGVARRQAHNTLRKHAVRFWSPEDFEELPDATPGPEGHSILLEDRSRLRSAIERLSVQHREVLALVLLEGLSYNRTASILGIPEGTVKSRLSHARRGLQALLAPQRRGEDEADR